MPSFAVPGIPQADVWYVAQGDIPGLATESAPLDALRRKRPGMIQDLSEDEGASGIDVIAWRTRRSA